MSGIDFYFFCIWSVAQMPFIYKWVAAMPDVHWGIGATVGSVIPNRWLDLTNVSILDQSLRF